MISGKHFSHKNTLSRVIESYLSRGGGKIVLPTDVLCHTHMCNFGLKLSSCGAPTQHCCVQHGHTLNVSTTQR